MGNAASSTINDDEMTQTTLILVDCQKDFHPGGSLAIPTANDDAERIAQLIKDNGTKINRIIATMDTHLKLHIAHPSFWEKGLSDEDAQNLQKQHPDPFTIITAQDLKNGVWKPRTDLVLPCDNLHQIMDPTVFEGLSDVLMHSSEGKDDATSQNDAPELDMEKYCIEYATRLEKGNQFQICVWPEHCLQGSDGHGLVQVIQEALHQWSEQTGRSVEFVCKGQNILTEMYSCFKAEVPVSAETALNTALLDSVLTGGSKGGQHPQHILVCGQAMSHCVNYTVRDMVDYWETTSTATTKPSERTTQIAVLTDCASAVPGFEDAAETFLKDMKTKGVHLLTAAQAFPSS